MNWIAPIICIALLSVIVFQDFKYRQIFWVTLPLLFLIFTAQSVFLNGFKYTALYFIVNFCFGVFILPVGVFLIATTKKKSLKETFKTFTSIGDVLFFLVLCTAFSPLMYLAYSAVSVSAAIISLVAWRSIVKNAQVSSPFAGIMALALIFLIVMKQFYPSLDFYDDEMIASVLRFR